jgi:hypothetical protein
MIARRSSVVRRPAKGLDCRNLAASSLDDRRSATTSDGGVESRILRHSQRAAVGLRKSQRSRFCRAKSRNCGCASSLAATAWCSARLRWSIHCWLRTATVARTGVSPSSDGPSEGGPPAVI